MPVPATGFRWFNETDHLTLQEARGKPSEHVLGEERPVLDKPLENPLVFERLHVFERISLTPDATFVHAYDWQGPEPCGVRRSDRITSSGLDHATCCEPTRRPPAPGSATLRRS